MGETGVWGPQLYDEASREAVPDAAVNASLGCGVPTAVADLRDGEIGLEPVEERTGGLRYVCGPTEFHLFSSAERHRGIDPDGIRG